MSVQAMSWVFKHSVATGNNRIVLLAIADEANSNGEDAFPSIDRIAQKTLVHRATVMRCIKRLEALGELVVVRPQSRGEGHFNRYVIPMSYPQESQTATLTKSHSSRFSNENRVAPVRLNPRTTRRDPRSASQEVGKPDCVDCEGQGWTLNGNVAEVCQCRQEAS